MFISDLPLEIFLKIFRYLNYIDVQSVALVCRQWMEICQYPAIQTKILLRICDITEEKALKSVKIFESSFRPFPNICIENCNIRLINNIIQHIGGNVMTVSFKKIEFSKGQFYRTILQLPKILEIRILNCYVEDETLLQTPDEKIRINNILCKIKLLSFKEIECDSWPLLSTIGYHLKVLEEFEISEYYYQESNTERYSSILFVVRQNASTLKRLIVKDIEDINFWDGLCKLKELFNRLEKFNCEYVCWEPEKLFRNFINHQQNLSHLNLSQSKALKDQDLIYIIDHLPSLKTLSLDFCSNITNTTAAEIFRMPNLEDLTIYECYSITGFGLENGLCHPSMTNRLKKFRISGLDVRDDFVVLLSDKLINLEVLEIKYPKTTNITDIAMQSIIKHLFNLTELSVEGCNMITDYGLTGVNRENGIYDGISIKHLWGLEVLDLSMCDKITDFSITHGIIHPKLRFFAVPFVPGITVSAMKTLIDNCPIIEHLDFQNDFEVDDLLEYAIANLKRLTYININRICRFYKLKFKNQYACVDRRKKEYFFNIECTCSVCCNARTIFLRFKKK